MKKVLLALLAVSFLASAEEMDIARLLRRKDVTISVDNKMFYHLCLQKPLRDLYPGRGDYETPIPGLLGVWYKPPELCSSLGRDREERTAVISVLDGERPLVFKRNEEKSYFQVDVCHQEFAAEDILILEDLALYNDLAIGRFEIRNPNRKKVTLRLDLRSMGIGEAAVLSGSDAKAEKRPDGSVSFGKLTSPQIIEVKINEDYHKDYTEFFGLDLPSATASAGIIAIPPTPLKYGSKIKRTKAYSIRLDSEALSGREKLVFSVVVGMEGKASEKGVRQAVETALKDTAGCLETVRGTWKKFFAEEVPGFLCSDDLMRRLYYWIYYVFKADEYHLNKGKFPDYICPSKYGDWLALVFDEDTAHIITGARWYNSREKMVMLEQMLLRFITKHSPYNFGLTTMAAWQLYCRNHDLDFLREVYRRTEEMQKRYTKTMTRDMVIQTSAFIIGWDYSDRFRWGGFNKTMRNFERPMIPVDLNAFLVREYQLLATMAKMFGEPEKAKDYEAKADHLAKKINEVLWDEKDGCYYDVFADDMSLKSRCMACSMFTPMLANISSKEQADRLFRLLTDPKKFGSPYAVPCLAVDEPKRGWGWSGDVCARNNHLIYLGTANYSGKMNRYIFTKTMKLFTQDGQPRAFGYHHPTKGTTRPPLFVTEISGALDMMILSYVGFEPLPDDRVKLFPASLPPETEYLQWGPCDYLGNQVMVRYDRPGDGKDAFGDGREGYSFLVNGRCVHHSDRLPEKPVFLTLKPGRNKLIRDLKQPSK